MHTAELAFPSAEAARSALEGAAKALFIGARPEAAPGTLCRLTLRCLDREWETFAKAEAGGYRLTEDPHDLEFGIGRFLEGFAPPGPPPPADSSPEADAGTDPGEGPPMDDRVLAEIHSETGSKNPLVAEMKRIQKLTLPQKIRLAEEGELVQRTLLYRMYGKLVFEAMLRNPRITEMEVSKLAKLGTLPVPVVQLIARKPEWIRAERVRTALLTNPRTPQAVVQKIISMLTKQDLKPLLLRRDLPPAVQAALRDFNNRGAKGST